MAIVETRLSVWEVLAGRAPGHPVGPADPGVWAAVVERLNPARAKPRLRAGIEEAHLTSVRGIPYVMLRSPDDRGRTCYLRLTPDERQLADLMDGTRTVARLVAEFVRICGRLAPDQVTRVVADLAGNRMLEELPLDAFRPLDRIHRRPWPVRLGRGILAAARGQRMVLANVDPVVGFLYRAGGRLFFTRAAAVLCGLVALAGLGVFVWTWWLGDQSVFLTRGSYATGALVLLGLNVVALACHELGHALATKHVGRRVPSAGFLVYFGIPSVFVDTTDVWMAGRRARILTTIAGPGAGLVLAGAAQIVGFAVPELAPWTFKLSFAWYVNALFNLNPFLALDGYYLLMDWLEVPNLRARGLAWVAARLRHRPPRWAQLDREGRLVALYGVLAVLWLAIAVNLGYRIYADRVSGLVTGLWRNGWPARVLLVAVVAGLASPLVYGVFRWAGTRWRRVRQRLADRRTAADLPRRIDTLRSCALGRLPSDALTALAASAAWVRPRTGEQVVFAGAAQPAVFVVAEGALEGRRPGDPAGTVRQRVGPGGVVGLANALTGAPASLAWLTAGTTLLAVPASEVARAVGPLPGPPPGDRAEVEELLATAPAIGTLSEEDRLGLASRAAPVALAPGGTVQLAGPDDALVLSSGVVALPDGTELRRGTLIGPAGEVVPGAIATARTPVRAFVLPGVTGLPHLLRGPVTNGPGFPGPASGPAGRAPGVRPAFGAHPPANYPPLAAPPGPPPSNVDDSHDRRFERILWWLIVLLLLLALLLTGSNLLPGPAWGEMRGDQALLRIDRGAATAVVAGKPLSLDKGDQVYVAEGDSVAMDLRSLGRLTFRGGSIAFLCAQSELSVGPLRSTGLRPTSPAGEVELVGGLMLADTTSVSPAFEPLALQVHTGPNLITNDGPAWFRVGYGDTDVANGTVAKNFVEVPPSTDRLSCGDGGTVARPNVPSATPNTSPSPSASPSESPSLSPSPSASPSLTPSTTRPSPTRTSPKPPPPPPPTTTGPPPPPPDTTAPTIGPPVAIDPRTGQQIGTINQVPIPDWDCGGAPTTALVQAIVTDDRAVARVWFDYEIKAPLPLTGTGPMNLVLGTASLYRGTFGGIPFKRENANGGTITIIVRAVDAAGNTATPRSLTLKLGGCSPIIK